jgi:hypothetical protein
MNQMAQKMAYASDRRAQVVEAKKSSGLASGTSALMAEAQAHMDRLRAHILTAELQESYAAYLNTLGRNFMPASSGAKT